MGLVYVARGKDAQLRNGLAAGVRDAGQPYDQLDIDFERDKGIYWCHLNPTERPSFTTELLRDLADMQHSIKRICAEAKAMPIQYFVVGSRLPGIFNLGGDLVLFADLIRRGNRDQLRRYAVDCVKVVYNNAVAYELPIVTIANVQGDALGGGFEAALSCDVIVAEKGTRFGLPEVLFNLFPGMGAYTLLARKLGGAAAEKMILSGRIFTAEELHAMELVHILAEPGEGESAVRDYIDRNAKRHNAQSAVYRAGRRVSPIAYQELEDVVEIWVDAALRLSDQDLRKMERLSSAQNRRISALAD
jgi:DSF synthase